MEPCENAAEIAKQYLPYNKDFKTVKAFAVAMAPENPAEFLKKYSLRFANEGKVSKKDSLFKAYLKEYENMADFLNELSSLPKSEINKNSYKYYGKLGGRYEMLASNFGHINNNEHPLTPEEWDDVLESVDDTNNIEYAKIADEPGTHKGTVVGQIVKGKQGRYAVLIEYAQNGRVYITTGANENAPNTNIDNWIKNIRGSQALQQDDIKQLAGGMGPTSYIKIIQRKLGIVKTFYKDTKSTDSTDYNQSQEGKYKGAFTLQADGSYVISMFKNGDASTVIHETGHYFFEVFMQESALDTASDKLKADRKAFLEYVGMTEEQWEAADFEGRRAAHERIATAFEQYLLEGKAPSRGLRGVFDRFSKWLKKIYGEVVQSPDYQEVPDNVRQAFDHWLAADVELEEAARMQGFYGKLDNRLTANLSPEKKKWLEVKIYSSHQTAMDMLTKQYMRNFAPKRRAEIEAYRKEITPQTEELADTIKVNVAREGIRALFTRDVNKTETVFTQVSADGKKRKVAVYKWVRLKTGEVVTVTADPATIASKYLHTIGTNYENPVDRMQQLQQEIDARLQPIIDEINRNIKEYKRKNIEAL